VVRFQLLSFSSSLLFQLRPRPFPPFPSTFNNLSHPSPFPFLPLSLAMPPPSAPQTNGIVAGSEKKVVKPSRNQLKREKKKAKKQSAGNEADASTTGAETETESEMESEVEVSLIRLHT